MTRLCCGIREMYLGPQNAFWLSNLKRFHRDGDLGLHLLWEWPPCPLLGGEGLGCSAGFGCWKICSHWKLHEKKVELETGPSCFQGLLGEEATDWASIRDVTLSKAIKKHLVGPSLSRIITSQDRQVVNPKDSVSAITAKSQLVSISNRESCLFKCQQVNKRKSYVNYTN